MPNPAPSALSAIMAKMARNTRAEPHVVERVGRMLREVKAIFAGCQVVGSLGEVEPIIVERGLVADDLERCP